MIDLSRANSKKVGSLTSVLSGFHNFNALKPIHLEQFRLDEKFKDSTLTLDVENDRIASNGLDSLQNLDLDLKIVEDNQRLRVGST